MGERQKQLLKLLRGSKPGLSVDELSKGLEITRNAVRQHLASLEAAGLVTIGTTRPSGGGRPQQLYILTELGKEMSPRQYSWLAQLVVASVRREEGMENMGKRMNEIGANVAQQIRSQYPHLTTHKEKVEKLTEVMDQLGYNARNTTVSGGEAIIEADNCVFHTMANKDLEICHLDRGLMEHFTDSKVEHDECMARGGNVCRFKLTSNMG
ncbi:metalloregulator ArsR/SmtB family transcription factor [Nitrosospira sp. Nsp13]|jgi:predicted ArsR family transcriptional regulator|uniref:helix-turn-helix transcriptional regulator n=1 Tax=Nitrosospira sp. Nsp13 TaxID=1855332 RepID=UPI000886CE18|nr:HTH domain-containing protein [Nitrosospira sp. Nsp13]SCY21561.1 transcriptional regulator [Nitrosospira sp. Nsp13]